MNFKDAVSRFEDVLLRSGCHCNAWEGVRQGVEELEKFMLTRWRYAAWICSMDGSSSRLSPNAS